jgi:Cation transporter/ATPase, N-terminus
VVQRRARAGYGAAGVDPAVGLSSERAATLLEQHGPNALPVEQAIAGWKRFAQVVEIALAVMITQMDLFNRLLKTTPLKAGQFGLALACAILLLVLWELGKLIARRQASGSPGRGGDG